MAHNTIKTRIQLKNDTEANWNKAINFVPREGEIIVYSADGSHPFSRLKVGDGNTNVVNLPFIDAGTINGDIPTFTDTNTIYTFSSLPNGDGIHILSSDDQIQVTESAPDSNGGITVTIGEHANEAIVRMNPLSDTMRFLGTTSTSISNGDTTATITLGSDSHTAATGDVVISSDVKYVWDGSAWQTLSSNFDSYFSQAGDMLYRDAQGIATLSIGQNGNYLMVNNGVPYWGSLSLPTATDTVSGITKLGATGGAATYSHNHGNINNDGTWSGSAGILIADNGGVLSTTTINPTSSETSTSADKYVSNVAQDSSGSITVTKSPLPEGSASVKGIVSLGVDGGAARNEDIVTAAAIKQDLGIITGDNSSTFLRKDGSWVVPNDTTYTAASNGGLALSGTAFSVAEEGITNGMLAGNISSEKLASNATITIGTQSVKVGNSFDLSTIAADLGITGSMTFVGITSTDLVDESTVSTLAEETAGSLTKRTNFIAGDVVISGHYEFIWTGSKWEKLGGDSSYKVLQDTAVSSPETIGTDTAFIATISQNVNGDISATKAAIPEASTSDKGIIQIATPDANGVVSSTDTLASEKAAAGNHTHYYAGSATVGGPATEVAQTLKLEFGPSNNTFTGVEDANQYTYKGDAAKTVRVVPGTDLEITASSNRVVINHSAAAEASGDTLSTPNTAQTPAFGATFSVPVVKKNARGHITALDTTTVTIPEFPSLSNTNAYTGVLPITKGGTGTSVLNEGEAGSVVVRESGSEGLSTRPIINNATPTAAVSSTGIPTMATLANTLTKINGNPQSYDTGTNNSGIYAPTSAGSSGQVLVSNGNTQAPSWSTLKNLVLDIIYPVGSIYISTNSTYPDVFLGGTWESFGAGRVLIGAGTGTDANNTSKTFSAGSSGTGGEYTHTITTAQMPSHTHTLSSGSVNSSYTNHNHDFSVSISMYHRHSVSITTGSESSHYHSFSGTTGDYTHSHQLGQMNATLASGSRFNRPHNYGFGDTTGYTSSSDTHTHSFSGSTGSGSSHSHSVSGYTEYSNPSASGSGTTDSYNTSHTHSISSLTLNNTGSGSAMNLLQPYIVVYMFKRIS